MNTAVDVPGLGLLDFESIEARKAAAFLAGRLPHIPDVEQPDYLKAVRELEQAADTDGQFDMDRYTPDWYVPGWQP